MALNKLLCHLRQNNEFSMKLGVSFMGSRKAQ